MCMEYMLVFSFMRNTNNNDKEMHLYIIYYLLLICLEWRREKMFSANELKLNRLTDTHIFLYASVSTQQQYNIHVVVCCCYSDVHSMSLINEKNNNRILARCHIIFSYTHTYRQ